jgi:uncharacterized membrane protein YphA (DoxX/SURF4 family)
MLINGLTLIARAIVGGIFIIVGLAKIKEPSSNFLNAILGYDLLPKFLAKIIAKLLPWFEVGMGACLFLGILSQFAAAISILLLLIFSCAITISLLRGKKHSCGCSNSLLPIQWWLVYRNLGLIGLSIFTLALKGGKWSIDALFAFQNLVLRMDDHFITTLLIIWVIGIGLAVSLQFLHRSKLKNNPSNP